jgi:glycolate oxidase
VIDTDVARRLAETLGERVSFESARLDAVRTDKSGHHSDGAPIAVVSVRSIDDVQAVMRIATETRTPVVIRGAGTGLAGGAIAGPGEIVLSTLEMAAVLEISPDDEVAVVQPGIINAELNVILEPYGLWFTPDPASRAISTVGGNIATNAGGLLCAKYGVTRESVLGLKVVLADGRLMQLGHRTIKGVTGLDLTALMIGSEGTLGVIVEATLKLQHLVPGVAVTVAAEFATVGDAARAASVIGSSGTRPAVMELLGESAVAAITSYLAMEPRSAAQLLVQFDGPSAQSSADAAAAVVQSLGGTCTISTDAAHSERLFEMRRSFHSAMAVQGTVLTEDVCVPRSALPAMFAAIGSIEDQFGITIPTVAHAGDGNLHPNFVFAGLEVPPDIWAAADELFLAALRLGGTLTGEHGIGILKRRWLRAELGDDQFELQREIKAVFDPQGILNPGKVF